KNRLNLYKDPAEPAKAPVLPSDTSAQLPSGHADEDLLSVSNTSDLDEIDEIQQQNRVLGKRSRTIEPTKYIQRDNLGELALASDGSSSDEDREPTRASFRPSATQRRVSRTILHQRFQGRSFSYIFEHIQQSVHTEFLAVPPVCRCLLDFGFGPHGLNLMHCRPIDLQGRIDAQESNISFTDFSERNALRPAVSPTSRRDVSEALRALRVFARYFYNSDVVELIDTASAFIDSYKRIPDSEAAGWKLMAYWVS
ncbi:hypothetical protein F443_23053, partial [Phytophthora nicotianae P1569]